MRRLGAARATRRFRTRAEEVADAQKRSSREEAAVEISRAGDGWTLAPPGGAEVAFAWKAAMQTLRVVDMRSLLRLAAILVALTVGSMAFGRASGLPAIVGVFALAAPGSPF